MLACREGEPDVNLRRLFKRFVRRIGTAFYGFLELVGWPRLPDDSGSDRQEPK